MQKVKSREEILHGIDRIGNALCLDFVNTVHSRFESDTENYVETYSELLLWAADGGLVSTHRRGVLETLSRVHPRQAQQVQGRAMELREILYRVFVAEARGAPVDAGDLATLNEWLESCSTHRRLVKSAQGFRWVWIDDPPRLDALLWPILDSAAKLLVSEDISRVKQCPAPDGCGWLFLDVSRNRSRRWCDMRVCGNVSKARRFQRKHSRSPRTAD